MAQAVDPTQKARDAVGGFIKSILPANSPLMKSGDDVLTPEARAKAEAENLQRVPADLQTARTVEAPPTSFINPGQAVTRPESSTPNIGISSQGLDPLKTYSEGANREANAIASQGQQEASALKNVQGEIDSINKDIQGQQSKEEEAYQQFEKEHIETQEKIKNFELKPKDFFAGKSTWQKILGGIGMFLGSITPEGANNVRSIIDKEIDRDLERQKNELALFKDSRSEASNRYKIKLERLGSEKLAKMSMKKDALEMVKLQLDQIASSAKGELARGAALKGKAVIEQSQQTISANIMKEYLKLNKDGQKGGLTGYEGSNQNPAIVKEMTDRITAKNSANTSIDDLEKLLSQGSLIGKNKEIAIQIRRKLAADLAKAMFGRSSDSELAIAESLIPDITSLMQRGSVDKALLANLRRKLSQDVEAAAKAAGFSKAMPAGARKVE